MGSKETYCLKWNEYRSNLSQAFQDLRAQADFFDVTLATDKAELRAHKVILSACSSHLRDLLKRHSNATNPNLVIYMRGVKHSDLEAILEFMYNGVVNVFQDDLQSFLEVAEDLQVRGLISDKNDSASGSVSPGAAPVGDRSQPKPTTIRSKGSVSLTPLTGGNSFKSSSKNGGSTSLTPVGHSSAAKRPKADPSVVIKEEPVKKKITPTVKLAEKALAPATTAAATASATAAVEEEEEEVEEPPGTIDDDDDDNLVEFDNDDDEMYYGEYDENDDSDQILVDPSCLGVPGPSGIETRSEEQDYLAAEIGQYLQSMSARRDDGHYQCLVCARPSRDLYNQRQHIMTHMMKDAAFVERLDHFVKNHALQENAAKFTCLLCHMTITRGFYMVRQHFFSKHLREDKFLENY